jgi:hypothetical protein
MPYHIPRCQVIPQAAHQVKFTIDGIERLRWHFSPLYPRPFLYPLIGPGGAELTRMGHPGDWGHDHHRSIWFAHHVVGGVDFWTENTPARIRQKRWLAYQDGDEAAMAVLLSWQDGNGRELLEQELLVIVSDQSEPPLLAPEETLVELQATFRPAAELLLGQSNFGFLAVRVAKSISAHFGGGQIRDSQGRRGEAEIFGKSAAWVDYSGPVPGPTLAPDSRHHNVPRDDQGRDRWRREDALAGIACFDHPTNAGFPSKWHVREDGWMGPSVCRDGPRTITPATPLVLRYLLHAHGGALDMRRASDLAAWFTHTPGWKVVQAGVKHENFRVVPAGA